MKKLILTVTMAALLITGLSAQENFEWDVIIDVPETTKEELYSRTKMFISENWKSAQAVIQNDDKDNGIILIKGITSVGIQANFAAYVDFKFNNTIKFMFKDNKCRIIVDNLSGHSGISNGKYVWNAEQVSDTYPGGFVSGLPKNKYNKLMIHLRYEINKTMTAYENYVNQPLMVEKDW